MAKAPSLGKDRSKGTQRTRKLSPGEHLWSWRNVKERFVLARRLTAGVEPDAVKAASPVLNGEREETGEGPRLALTQLECGKNGCTGGAGCPSACACSLLK